MGNKKSQEEEFTSISDAVNQSEVITLIEPV